MTADANLVHRWHHAGQRVQDRLDDEAGYRRRYIAARREYDVGPGRFLDGR
ncbi:hypothetical protein D3C76_1751940 [compost metagenome]